MNKLQISYIIIIILIILIISGLLSPTPCPVCPVCDIAEDNSHRTYKLDMYTKSKSLYSLNDKYVLSLNKDKLELLSINGENKEIISLWKVKLDNVGEYLTGNFYGQLVVVNKDLNEIFKHPISPPNKTMSYIPYYIYLSNDGELIMQKLFRNNERLYTQKFE
jgi:hypothetical protein